MRTYNLLKSKKYQRKRDTRALNTPHEAYDQFAIVSPAGEHCDIDDWMCVCGDTVTSEV